MFPHRLTYLGIFALCAGLLGFGYYLQYMRNLEPCPLCIIQRLCFAVVGLASLVGAMHNPGSLGVQVYSILTGLFALCGAGVAVRQVWLQHLPADQVPECGPGLEYMLEVYPLGETIAKVLKGSGECAEAGWSLLGLSIAGWALVFFALMTLASQLQVWKARGRSATPRPANSV